MANDSDRRASTHQQLIVVGVFLGGLSFAALVLILQSSAFSPSGFWGTAYFDVLITLLGGVTIAFIMSSLSSIGLAAGTVTNRDVNKRDNIAKNYFVLGFLGLIGVIPLLFLPFFWEGFFVIVAFEIILFRRSIWAR